MLPGGDFSYLINSAAMSGARSYPAWDSTNTAHEFWETNFGPMINTGAFRYAKSTGAASTGVWAQDINTFNVGWELEVHCSNGTWSNDKCDFDIEFLDSSNNVIAALRGRADGNYRHGLWYGPSLASLTKALQSGSYPRTNGILTFSNTSIIWTHDAANAHQNKSFTLAGVDMSSVVRMRLTNMLATSTYTGGAGGSANVIFQIVGGAAQYNLSGTVTQNGVPLETIINVYDAQTGLLLKVLNSDITGHYQHAVASQAPVYLTAIAPPGYRPLSHGPIVPKARP